MIEAAMGNRRTGRTTTVSVIMIFLNAEAFIEEAIESVLSQTFENWHLQLVDDGSVDASTAIAKAYANQYPQKIRYLEHRGHQNRGMSVSRNLGIQESKGDYVAFLDADDVYLPQKLERQASILDAHPEVAMVYGATEHWYSWTGRPEDSGRDVLRKLGVATDTVVAPPALIPLFLRGKAQTPGTCGVLVRRQAIQQIGGFEEQFRGMFEDQVFFYKLCLSAPVYVESGRWDRYRRHSDSHSHTSDRLGFYALDGRPNLAYYRFLEWLERYLVERQITNSEVWQAFQLERRRYHHPLIYNVLARGRGAKKLTARMNTMVYRVYRALARFF
jgi:glycosyltransferase involved in cell wall biosynthesis